MSCLGHILIIAIAIKILGFEVMFGIFLVATILGFIAYLFSD